jgi:hypothetical protein
MKYYLATNEVDVFHYGEMEDSSMFTTGQPVSFVYVTREELIEKLADYGQEYQGPQEVGISAFEEGSLPEAPPMDPEL